MKRSLVCIILCTLIVLDAIGQRQTTEITVYDVDLRHIQLDEALAEFSAITGSGVTYDPRITRGHTVYCVLNDAAIHAVLECLLESTALTYARLASGTFLVMPKGNLPPENGYLSGLVTDHSTGTPLGDAHILLASNTLDVGAITNKQGQFILPALLPGRYLVQTSYLGYSSVVDTLDILPGEKMFHRVELTGQPLLVTPIVIDGLHLRKPSDQLEKTLLIRSSTAQTTDAYTFPDQFKSTAGVRINDITADAHVQGSNSGEHQFRIDGVPIFLPQQAIGIFGPFSPFAIQSLTIHKSGFGVEEGSHLAGVIEARQFLESESMLDAQVDLNAINNRLSWQHNWGDQKSVSIMAASRFSLWSLISQPQLETMLNRWVRPDPFLIFAPTQQFSSVDFSFFQDALDLSAIPTTELSFSDIHFASRYKSGPFSGLNTSFYYGSNQFSGTLIPPAILSANRFNAPEPAPTNGGLDPESNFQPILSVIDDYTWHNLAGQVSYYTLLGKNTLFNIQARGSTYSLDQRYLQVDSLEYLVGGFGEEDFATVALDELQFPTSEIEDTNTTSEYSIEGQIDFTQGTHSLVVGLSATFTESKLDVLLTSLPSLQSGPETDLAEIPPSEPIFTDKERVGYASATFRQSLFIQDRITLSDLATIEAGSRFTYLPDRNTVYAEPRLSLRFDLPAGLNKTLSVQTAAGLYRQFLLQLDVSTLNAGALFPSKRLWIPVNQDIRPPLAYHLSQSLLFTASQSLTFQLEGYLKIQQRMWLLSYISQDIQQARADNFADTEIEDVNDILSPGKGVTHGISLSTTWRPSPVSITLVYDYTSVRRRSPDLFFNSWFSAPWEEPHRLTANMEWNYQQKIWLSARFTGIWNRSWGYRQAYYDFFGHSSINEFLSGINFSNPDEHVLPAYYQVDLGAVYNLDLNDTHMQLRVDLLNAFDITNVADWRLIWKDGSLQRENRNFYPIIPSVALRFSW